MGQLSGESTDFDFSFWDTASVNCTLCRKKGRCGQLVNLEGLTSAQLEANRARLIEVIKSSPCERKTGLLEKLAEKP